MQVNDSPPCSFPHRRSLWCSTDPAASSGAGGDRSPPSHPPAGSQTKHAGDSLRLSVKATYKKRRVVKNAILQHGKTKTLQETNYLAVDVTGKEGGTKHHLSSITDEDGVTTERGLLIGQKVESILVWWFNSTTSPTSMSGGARERNWCAFSHRGRRDIPSKAKRNIGPRKPDLTASQKCRSIHFV